MAGSMNCFPCFTSQKSKKSHSKREQGSTPQENVVAKTPDMKKRRPDEPNQVDTANIQAQTFTFRELATATKNFRQECLMGEGGFGRVYKGTIPATGQVVAVKQLDRNRMQGSKEFLVEVLTLSLLHHENLVNLIGYCADGDQRLLVYEFMSGGSIEDRLLVNKRDQPPLDWFTRMKVAAGAARGLEYLHDTANPPVIYRDLKASNILLDNDLNAKLSDFGLAKLSGGDKMNPAPPRVMGTYGYCAPEYVRTGQLTLKSDVYSFGVVLLELITGRRAIDTTRPHEEQNLVSWAQPLFRDPKRFPDMADPLLNKHFPEKDLNQAVAIAAMCIQEEAEARPLMSDVVTTLSFLSMVPPEVIPASLPPATSVSKESAAGESESESESGSEAETGKESHRRDSFHDEDGEGSGHEDNDTAQNQGAASAKYQESDVSDIEDDYYKNENQHGSDSQEDIMESKEFYSSKSSRKSSTRSRDGIISSSRRGSFSSDSEDRSVSSSNKSSRKSHEVIGNLSQKSSRKSSVRDLSQKSSKKSSVKDLSQKSSRKSSVRVLSHKISMESEDGSVSFEHSDSRASHGNASLSRNSSSVASEDGGVLFERSGSRLSQGNISFGLISSESVHSDHSSSRRTEEGSIHLDNASSRGSDEGSGHPFDHASGSGSDEASVHSR